MASSRIQGITIELDGNTSGLTDALKEADKQAKELEKELKEVDKALKLDPTNVDLMAQRQEILAQTITATSKRLDVLRQSQAQVEQQFANGDIGADQYRAFQRELSNTESRLGSLSNEVTSSAQNQQRLIQSTRDFNTLLQATGTELDDYAELLGARMTNAIRNGTASTDQMNRAIRLVGQNATGTTTDLQTLQQTLRNVDNGTALTDVRNDLRELGREAQRAEDSVDDLSNSIKGAAAGLVAGGGLAAAVSTALDVSTLNTQIKISMGLNEEDTKAVRRSIMETTAAIGDEEAAYEGVRRQMALNKDASVATNAEIIKGASAIAKAFKEVDFKELIQETNEISKELGISQKESLGLVDSLLKVGFPPEQLDIIAEYGNQLKRAGFEGKDIQALFAAGVDTGTWNIDNLMDGLKEGRVRAAEFGKELSDAQKTAIVDAGLSTAQFEKWGAAVAGGGEKGNKAFVEMTSALDSVEDATERNSLGTELFGTMWEDQGENIIDTILNMNDNIKTSDELIGGLGESVQALDDDPLTRIKLAIGSFKEELEPVLSMLAEFVADIADWALENDKLVISMVALAGGIAGILAGMTLLSPIVKSILDSFKLLGGAIALITSPVGLLVVGLTALVAAFVYAYNESETFRDGVNSVFKSIKETVKPAVEEVTEFVKEKFGEIKAWWDENGAQILEVASVAFEGIKAVIETVMPIIASVIKSTWEDIQGIIEGAINIITGVIEVFTGVLTGDFEKAGEGVKKTFKGLGEFLVNILEVVILGKILGGFKLLGTGITKAVTSMVDSVKKLFSNMVDSIKSILKVDIFIQLGKDLISGFVKGITGAAEDAVKAVGKVFTGIVAKARSILDSHSPSRVFISIGHDTLDGYNIGLEEREKLVTGTMEDIMGTLVDVADHYAQEEQKIAEESGEKIADIERKKAEDIQKVRDSASKKKEKNAKDDAAKIQKITNDANKKIADIQKKATVDTNKLTAAQRKTELEEIEKYISEKNSLNQLGVMEEVYIWQTAAKYFEEGTKERIKAQNNYKKAVEAINKDVLSTNDNFSKQILDVQNKFATDSAKMWDDYYKELDARSSTIAKSMGALGDLFKTEEVDGKDLINAQQSQVDAMLEWRSVMEGLYTRIDNEELIEELQQMGVKGLGQVKALNQMTQPELDNFVQLYSDKFRIAAEIAESELSESKTAVEKNVKAMKRAANDELDILNDQWKQQIRNITKNTDNELSSLEQVGQNAGNSLLAGLTSTEGALTAKAKEIADSIKNTIGQTLGVNMGEGESTGPNLSPGGTKGVLSGVKDALNNTKSSMNNMRNGIQKSSNQQTTVSMANVYMDGSLVGKATVNTVSGMQYNQTGIKAMTSGVNLT